MKEGPDNEMHSPKDSHYVPMTSVSSGKGREVKSDIYYYTDQIVNFLFIGDEAGWVLVDAGMPNSAAKIKELAAERFGKNSKPSCIVLTHGHFDHVGSLVDLVKEWNVPVYAHPEEFPFLTGERDYPDPDPTVEGGLLAKMASLYPHKATNVKQALQPLPRDFSVPGMPGWQWVHTPGHSPGHVSFFREIDRTLVAGDAFVTVKQDSFYKVLVQKEEVCGPPVYLTTDWKAARESVKKLEMLRPVLAICGHGNHMQGADLTNGLRILVEEFEEKAVPKYGKYVHDK